MYAEGPAKTTTVITVAAQPDGTQPVIKQVTVTTASVAGQPVYAAGNTRYLGLDSAKGRQPVCLNTCSKAKNGVCNDGRSKTGIPAPDIQRDVFCDLGTDCDDCGPWTPSGDAPWADGRTPGPIARLVSKGVEVRLKTTVTQPPFDFAYTNPVLDVDVSSHMHSGRIVEGGITKVFYSMFKPGCMPHGPTGKRALFVDVGSNFGWFAVQAASLGCRVLAFEPVPHFHAFLEYSVHLNGFAHLVDMRSNVVSHESGKTMEMFVPNRGIWGTAGIGGLNIDRAVANNTNEVLHVPSQTLDELVHEDVLLIKVDVEGWEWSVMMGAAHLMNAHVVQNVAMEYSPGVPERHFKFKEMTATVQMLVNLVDAGFRIAHMGDQTKHLHGEAWDAPLKPFKQITRHNLMYDLLDVALFAKQKLGCPFPSQLSHIPTWGACNCLPEDVNPRSLRSTIGHNTNLWASRQPNMPLAGVEGIILPSAPPNQYFVDLGSQFGSGSRPCNGLAPMVQVRHRCPCTKPSECGIEEEAAKQASVQGLMPSSYTLTQDGRMAAATGAPAELLAAIGTAEALGMPYRPGAVKGPLSETNKPLGTL